MHRESLLKALALFLALPAAASGAPATYPIDLRFLTDNSRIQPGSQSEIDRYNASSGNLAAHPVFTETAVLDFGSKKVTVLLIASHHDGTADVDFIEKALAANSVDPKTATIFVEQSDPYDAQGAVTVLRRSVQARAPDLMPALDTAARNPKSILDPDFYDKLTFAKVARHWAAAGGKVVNMDLDSNFDDSAIAFLSQQASLPFADHFLRIELDPETFLYPDFKRLLKAVYGTSLNPNQVDSLADCCGTTHNWIQAFLQENQTRDLIRERYMRHVLLEGIRDGDVILTHPVHMGHLLAPEQRPSGAAGESPALAGAR